MINYKSKLSGFTLIELMIVMSIVALLGAMVGPMVISSFEKAQAKQELLTLKNWFKQISYRAYIGGQSLKITLDGKQTLLMTVNEENVIKKEAFEFLFFQPQELLFNNKGFVSPLSVTGTYRNQPLKLDLGLWINGAQEKDGLDQEP